MNHHTLLYHRRLLSSAHPRAGTPAVSISKYLDIAASCSRCARTNGIVSRTEMQQEYNRNAAGIQHKSCGKTDRASTACICSNSLVFLSIRSSARFLLRPLPRTRSRIRLLLALRLSLIHSLPRDGVTANRGHHQTHAQFAPSLVSPLRFAAVLPQPVKVRLTGACIR